jgi:hypothetical protein
VDVDLFAGAANLDRAIGWFDRFFGEAESFD